MTDYTTTLDEQGHPMITDFASVFPNGNVPKPRDRRLWPTIGKPCDRLKNYEKVCRQTGETVTIEHEPGRHVVIWHEPEEHSYCRHDSHGAWRQFVNKSRRKRTVEFKPARTIIRNAHGWAEICLSDETEREQLRDDTAQAVKFWAGVADELNRGTQ